MTEREIKLTLPGRFALPTLFLDGAPLEALPMPDLTLRATYFDTADLRLARNGVTVRYRTGEEHGPVWTVKLPVAASDHALERNELNFEGARREPPAEVRSLVTAFVRQEPLVAVATLRTRRRVMRLAIDEEEVAELADDEVSVVEGRRVVSRFREIEVEALRDGVALEQMAEQLRRAGATASEPIPKVVRALGSRATAPPDVPSAALPDEPTMRDAVAIAISDALARLLRNDPLARLGNAEGIHQVRVSLRRLRSDLRTLGDAVDPAWREAMEPRLREVAGALGDARDLDVLIDRLRQDTDGTARAALRPLFGSLEARRSSARAAMQRALDSAGYPALLDDLVAAATGPPIGPGADAPVNDALPDLVMAAWRRLESRAEDLDADSPDEDFHRARIAAKRARYATELAARILDSNRAEAATRLASRLAKAQDQLGAVQDAAVAETAIRATLDGRSVKPRYAFDAGRLFEQQQARAREARSAFLAAWPKLRRRKWRKWAE